VPAPESVDPSTSPWPGDWLRGVLEMAVLRVLADTTRSYGYAISVALERQGLGAVKGGTLYPLLGRLEAAGHVATQWEAGEGGPGRKYYTITPTGRKHLERAGAAWCAFAETTAAFLRGEPAGLPPAVATVTQR
jgi:PadR family transcriptional regulator PadR